MAATPERTPTVALRAGRRAIDGIPGVAIVDDLSWDAKENAWVLVCRVQVGGASSPFVPDMTDWYFLVDHAYPWGRLDIHPAASGSLCVTFQHQRLNAHRPPKRWRDGRVCTTTGLHSLQRTGYDIEPRDAEQRLAWHVMRLREWLIAADRGELAREGEPFELPDYPHGDSPIVAFSEAAETYGAWTGTPERVGLVEFSRVASPTRPLVVRRFLRLDHSLIHSPRWGTTLDGAPIEQDLGVWFRLDCPPFLPPWCAPVTWGELGDALHSQGVDLAQVLRTTLRLLRDGKPHVALLGFPVPARIGESPRQQHWLALRLPVASHGTRTARGFRPNESGYWQRDRTSVFAAAQPITWLKTENWHEEELSSRGRLPAACRQERVLVIGVGAVGACVAELLVRGGVHHVVLIDGDHLGAGNLVRHTLTIADLGKDKAAALAARLNATSPHARVEAINDAFPPSDPASLKVVAGCTVVVDCTGSDEVLAQVASFPWEADRLFVSVSVGLGARRLFCFAAIGREFPHDRFREAIQPWLALELEEQDGIPLPREGVGCWHPAFPARIDDVWLLAAAAVKELEQVVVARPAVPNLAVYEQSPNALPFTGFKRHGQET